ncbi:MAG: YihY/virulence factor BrkB family protein [Fermentimonas sp.]|jgi:membrane protein
MAEDQQKNSNDEVEKLGRIERLKLNIKELIKFLTYDIWRKTPDNQSSKKSMLYDSIKVIILTIRNIQKENLAASSRSLTYRTLLSIVPLFAVIFAIARGFGIENIMQSSIFNFMTGSSDQETTKIEQQNLTTRLDTVIVEKVVADVDGREIVVSSSLDDRANPVVDVTPEETTGEVVRLIFRFIENSLEEAKGGGLFAGIGVILFLYTVLLLFNDIENNLNRIWQITRGRTIARKITDYFAMVLFLPIFFIIVNALNILSYPQNDTLKILYILYPVIPTLLDVVPYVFIILVFTTLYKVIPNTKVKFTNALIGGIVAGIAFQIFQMIYLSGQLWITKYNAIYGTFAAIPLMLLWIQFSWFIALIGAELSYAAQNVSKFSFEKETRNISRRYKDYFTLMITSVIVKRFEKGLKPYTADQISVKCQVPSRLTNDILDELVELKIISPTPTEYDENTMAYQPAIDINKISVNFLIGKIDEKGSEDFMIDMTNELHSHWKALIESRSGIYESGNDVLLKDL